MNLVIAIGLGMLAAAVIAAIAKRLFKAAFVLSLTLAIGGGVLWFLSAGEEEKQDLADHVREIADEAKASGQEVLQDSVDSAREVASEAAGEAISKVKEASGEAKAAVKEKVKEAVEEALEEAEAEKK